MWLLTLWRAWARTLQQEGDLEHSKAKDSLAELSPCIVYQLVPSPWHKCSSRAGLELATLLPQPKCWDFDNVSPHLAELHGLILFFVLCFVLRRRR